MKYNIGEVYIDDDGDRFLIIGKDHEYIHGKWISVAPPHENLLGYVWKCEYGEMQEDEHTLDKEYKIKNLLNQIDSMESTNGKA